MEIIEKKAEKIYTKEEAEKASIEYFKGDVMAAEVWVSKYSLKDMNGNIYELTPNDMHIRIAKEFARIEKKYKNGLTEEEIFELIKGFTYVVPQGSPMAGIGNNFQTVSISNCFVAGNEFDSYGGILHADEQLVNLMKRRGGVGLDLSHIRPIESFVNNSALSSTGVVPFMERYSNSTKEVSQCIAKGQRVLTKRGLIKIEEVVKGDLVLTKIGFVGVLDVLLSNKKVFKVKTKKGYTISTSKKHVFIDSKNEEKCLENFVVGDNISLIVGTNESVTDVELIESEYSFKRKSDKSRYLKTFESFEIPKILNEDLAYLIGFSYGDGFVQHDKFEESENLSLSIEHKRPLIKEKIENILKKFNLTYNIKKGDGALDVISICKKFTIFLSENGLLKQKSDSIIFPEKIIDSKKEVQMSFIAGYFDADGDNAGKKAGYRFRSIKVEFLENLQKILLMNGIISSITFEDRPNEKWMRLYTLSIVGKYSQENFVNIVENRSIKVIENKHISKRDNVLTPFSPNSLGFKVGKYKFLKSNTKNMSINAFSQLSVEHKNGIVYPLFIDKIISIEDDGCCETFDLVLEKENLFYCEGFYVHNSGRRGALMLSISVNHPDAENFIDAKLEQGKVTGANISVKLTDEFMQAVLDDKKFTQKFPVDSNNPIYTKEVSAQNLWKKIIHNAWKSAEPGVLFWTTAMRESVPDCYADKGFKSTSTNPCGEIILCPYDSCRLIAINLYSYVENPFTPSAYFNYDLFKTHVKNAQRLMDDIVDLELEKIESILSKIEKDPEPEFIKSNEKNLWMQIKEKAELGRRAGLGITAEGDMLAALGLIYGTDNATNLAVEVQKTLKLETYRSSVQLAKERGHFEVWDMEREMNNPFILRIKEEDGELYKDMMTYGRRNIALLTIAPTGSVSVLTQTTSGIEPVFLPIYMRRRKINSQEKNVRIDFTDKQGDTWQEYPVFHHKFGVWLEVNGYNVEDIKRMSAIEVQKIVEKSPYFKATSNDVDWIKKVEMQGRIQKHVDHSISVTVNLPKDATEELVAKVYETGWRVGCKGLTVYRDGCRSGVLLSGKEEKVAKVDRKNHAPKRPRILNADVITFQNKYEKWVAVVGKHDFEIENGELEPFEIFTGKLESFSIPSYVEKGQVIKRKVKNEDGTEYSVYDFKYIDKDGYPVEMAGLSRSFDEEFWNYAKLISAILRHGMPMEYVVGTVDSLKLKGDSLNTWQNGVIRILKRYIKDGTESSDKCPSCGAKLVYIEGCLKCEACGKFSKCG